MSRIVGTPTVEAWNRVSDFEKRHRLGTGKDGPRLYTPTDIIRIKNSSGGDLALGSVLSIGANLLTDPAGTDYLWHTGGAITIDTVSFAIARRPMPTDAIDEGQVSGGCVARVNILNESHTRAFPKAGQSYLESGMIGPVVILSRASTGTGVKDCNVLLGQPIVPLLGITVDAITRTADTTINLVKRTATGYTTWLDGSSAALSVEARCFLLNDDEEIEANRAVHVTMVEGFLLEVNASNCSERTFELEDE